MQSKHELSPSKGAAEEASAQKKRRLASNNSPPVLSLPLDVLSLIFFYAPERARLWELSLVCKRWREGVRHSMTSFTFWGAKRVLLLDAISLFPNLVHIRLRNTEVRYLPTMLRGLHLGKAAVKSLLTLEHQNASTLLSDRFPHLNSLALSFGDASFSRASNFVRFLTQHATQLRSFQLKVRGNVDTALYASVLQIPLPNVTHARLSDLGSPSGIMDPILRRMTSLKELELEAYAVTSGASLELLQPLVSLRARIDAAFAPKIAALPNLREVWRDRFVSDEIAPFDASLKLYERTMWESINRCTDQVRKLTIDNSFRAGPPECAFPNLRELQVGYSAYPMSGNLALYTAYHFMLACPRLTHVTLYIYRCNSISDLRRLVAAAKRSNVHFLHINLLNFGKNITEKDLDNGWVTVTLRQRIEGSLGGSEDEHEDGENDNSDNDDDNEDS